MSTHVVVIGAGLGGLSAAMRLAYHGTRVSVYEKNFSVGGKMQEVVSPNGYRFDAGPTLITMPHVFEDLFTGVGRKLSDYLTFTPLEIPCRYHFADGSVFNAYADLEKLRDEIARVFPDQLRHFDSYFKRIKELYRITAESFIYNPLTLKSLLRVNPLDFFSIDAFSTAHERNAKSFTDKRFVQFLDRFPTYVGSSPYRAPATLNVIPFVELAFGGFYVKGGMQRLADAYKQVCDELGVTFYFGKEATKITVKNNRANGVEFSDGETVVCDAVISNDDAVHTYERLLNSPEKKYVSQRKLDALEASCSGFVLMLGVGREHSQLNHHNIFFSSDYEREFSEIFDAKVPPNEPTIYLSVSAKSDAGQAPQGKENWFLLINAPYLSGAYDWDKNKEVYRNAVFDRLKRLGFSEVEEKVEFERMFTPVDLKDKFNANRGSIYGITSNNRFAAFLRPSNRSREVRGLYFASGSAHPGGGTPMVTLSGKFAAELLMEDFLIHR